MKAELLTIGNEILIGQIVNTNAVWMAQQLNLIGVTVVHMTTIADDAALIAQAMQAAASRADIVLMTGGLGPTKDDVTKKTFADFFGRPLVLNADVLEDVNGFFEKRGRPLSEVNRKQAEVPEGCLVLRNKNGTAPGMWMEKDNTVYVSMPGVPFEMKGLMTDLVIPEIKKRNTLPFIYHRTILTQGIGESVLAELISDWEDALAPKHITLAYLPSPGMVRLRLSSGGADEAELKKTVDAEVEKLKALAAKYIYGEELYGQETPLLEQIVGKILKEKGLKLALAESCTGGYISHLITGVAGSSEYFNGCIVPYQNVFKHSLLKVDEELFTTKGAVSEACVQTMATEVRKVFNADVSIAVSGIAGPGGGTPEKPVGTVWLAISIGDRLFTKKFLFGDNRGRNIHMTAIASLNTLRKLLLGETTD